jgi:hypothetical protein
MEMKKLRAICYEERESKKAPFLTYAEIFVEMYCFLAPLAVWLQWRRSRFS